MTWHAVADADELADGERKIVKLDGRSIGLFRFGDAYYAVLNFCPHAGAPVCAGRVTGRVVSDETGDIGYDAEALTLRCPWHHWEFDLPSGEAVAPGVKQRLKTFPVRVSAGRVEVEL